MLYPPNKVNKINKEEILWDILKSIGVDAKWAQKKEEQEKEIKKDK